MTTPNRLRTNLKLKDQTRHVAQKHVTGYLNISCGATRGHACKNEVVIEW